MMSTIGKKGGSLRQWMTRGAICASLAFGAGYAAAAPLTLDFSGDNVYSAKGTPTGASATVSMDFADVDGDVEIRFTIQNTTGGKPFGAGAARSKFTGLALDLVDGLSLISTGTKRVSGKYSAADKLLSPVFFGGISNRGGGAGKFDFAIADNKKFMRGKPRGGLRAGQSVTVSLLFDTIDTASGVMAAYADALFDPDSGVDAAVRFQRVKGRAGLSRVAGGALYTGPRSDSLRFVAPAPVPLPAALPLLAGALGGLGFVARRRRRKA